MRLLPKVGIGSLVTNIYPLDEIAEAFIATVVELENKILGPAK